MGDTKLYDSMATLVTRTDTQIQNDIESVLEDFLIRESVDIRLLDGNEIGKALKAFYKKRRLAGRFIKLIDS